MGKWTPVRGKTIKSICQSSCGRTIAAACMLSLPGGFCVSSRAYIACSFRSVRSSSRSPLPATKVTFCEFVSSRSRSATNVLTLICSWLLFRIVPTTTTGCRWFELEKLPSHGYSSASLTIVSATILESVSFQRPLRSVTTSESTLVILVSWAQPASTTTANATSPIRPRCIIITRYLLGNAAIGSRSVRALPGCPFVFFFLKPLKKLIGIPSDVVTNLGVEFLRLIEIFLHLLEIEPGQHVVRVGLLILVAIDGTNAAEGRGR